MIPRLALTLAALRDVNDAMEWYDAQHPGLGSELLDELDQVLTRVVEGPLQFPQVEGRVRRALLRRFPYAVYFVMSANRVDVIAVLHQHRNPETWQRRS